MIAIEHLTTNMVKKPVRAGTGYIKLKTFENGEYYVYRFYNNDFYPRSIDHAHTHSTTFHSTILKGTLRNVIYDVKPTDKPTQYYLTQGGCGFNTWQTHQMIHENVEVSIAEEFTKSEGEDYTLDSTIFHRIIFDTPAVITRLRIVEKAPIAPYYVIDRKADDTNPWNDTLSTLQCWDVIRYCLST